MFWDYRGSTVYFIRYGMHKFIVAELVFFFLQKMRICATKRKQKGCVEPVKYAKI